jgi:uncharacterized protein
MDQVPMELIGVRIELPTNIPILLLRETGGTRYLPIWIGTAEATAIALALEGVEPQRPMTHDLLKTVAETLGATVSRVEVTALNEGTFYADLVLARNGSELRVSSRPSDAIALAARTEAPLFADRGVLDEAGVVIQEEGEEEQEIERFREFLDEVSPEDFGSESS